MYYVNGCQFNHRLSLFLYYLETIKAKVIEDTNNDKKTLLEIYRVVRSIKRLFNFRQFCK